MPFYNHNLKIADDASLRHIQRVAIKKFVKYGNDPKFSNGADPDQTAPREAV